MPDVPGPPEETVTFVLDGREVTARKGEMIISAAERAGTYIPRFCHHPRMKPVGMCRMCLVEVSGPRGATLQPSCYMSVADGMEVVTASDKVKKAQDGVLELLLVNHPLDCPVCDKGGECPLQDQTLAYGPGESRFVEEKRHFEKPIALSELVLLDRERCIQCARCTRFAAEVAGEALIDFAGRGERVEVATFPDRPFSSYFSGNTVQICPVGALTATPYRFTARPWDLDQVESTCTTCAVGCRVAVQSSANRITRLLGVDADPVNQSWLCDKGRYAYEAVNGDEVAATPDAPDAPDGRVTQPLVRRGGELVPAGWGEALRAAADGLRAARSAGGPGAVALLGGARSTNEGAYVWAKLMKGVLGTDSVDAQLGDGLPADLVLGLPQATIDEACHERAVLLHTGDLREELPVLFLRLRRAAVDRTTTLLEVGPVPTALTPHAAVSLTVRPGDTAAAVRALLGGGSAEAHPHPAGPTVDDADLARARRLLADGLPDGAVAGTGVVVVLGRPSVAEHESVVADAARALAQALPGARFLLALRRGNVRGALELGLAPGVLPGRVGLEAGRAWFSAAWGAVPDAAGRDAAGILSALAGGEGVRALVALGADVAGDYPDRGLAARALEAADFVVDITGHRTSTTDHADVVLPVAVAHERAGTTTNVEGRVSRLSQKLVPPGEAWPDWMIAAELAAELGGDLGLTSDTEIWSEVERLAPAFAGCTARLLDAAATRDGVVVPVDLAAVPSHPVHPIDPMGTPGIESAERQGAPPRVGQSAPPPSEGPVALGDGTASGGDAVPGTGRPAAGAGIDPAATGVAAVHVGPADSYSLRLVARRRLYDAGAAVTHSPSLRPLVPAAEAHCNPHDLDALATASGEPVRLRSARGTVELAGRADDGVPRGVVVVDANVPAGAGTLHDLIDAAGAVTEVRMESVR